MGIRAVVLPIHHHRGRRSRDTLDARMHVQIPHEDALVATRHQKRLRRMALHLTNTTIMSEQHVDAGVVIVGIPLAHANAVGAVHVEQAIPS